MIIKNVLIVCGVVVGGVGALCFIPFMAYIVFPFFFNLTPEKRLEKLVDVKCVEGNEIAIQIRQDRFKSYYSESDCRLIRAAIEGNKYAIKALKLDSKEKIHN
jgi:hypothetical protein